jgi:hypothetical protein
MKTIPVRPDLMVVRLGEELEEGDARQICRLFDGLPEGGGLYVSGDFDLQNVGDQLLRCKGARVRWKYARRDPESTEIWVHKTGEGFAG